MSHRESAPAGQGPALSEATVVARAQDGDVGSFEVLVRRYQGPLFRLAQRMLADHAEAEDIVQDVFVLAWRRLPMLVDPELFRSWLFQIANRRCLTRLRDRARRSTVPTDTLEFAAQAGVPASGRSLPGPVAASEPAGADPAAAAEQAARLRGLDAVLASLPVEQRVCWILKEMDDLTYAEIAYVTQVPIATVRGRLARARSNLVKGMDQWR